MKQEIQRRFTETPELLPAAVASELNISELEVIHTMAELAHSGDLPEIQMVVAAGNQFEMIIEELRGWGDIMLVLDVEGSIFEMVTPFPKGGKKFGYYNMSDRNTPLKGHLKLDGYGGIALVRKPFHGVDTCSVQFFSPAGRPVFKVYIRRNKDKSFIPEQLERFNALMQRLAPLN
ncbi:heme utilization cystosolic carrier protein HutX [Endozoicomonadaceae bacterium StTr2]